MLILYLRQQDGHLHVVRIENVHVIPHIPVAVHLLKYKLKFYVSFFLKALLLTYLNLLIQILFKIKTIQNHSLNNDTVLLC